MIFLAWKVLKRVKMTESNNAEELDGSLILKIGFCAIYKNMVSVLYIIKSFSSLDFYQYILILKLTFHKQALENSLVRIDETQY